MKKRKPHYSRRRPWNMMAGHCHTLPDGRTGDCIGHGVLDIDGTFYPDPEGFCAKIIDVRDAKLVYAPHAQLPLCLAGWTMR
jgi:hypothetical protein